MKRWPWLAGGFLAAAAVAHFAVLAAIPGWIMDETLLVLGRDGARVNTWIHARPASPDSRVVVRPSTELAYSLCVYDLSGGPVRVRVAPWPDYWSLSIYGTETDNYATWNDKTAADGIGLLLIGPDAQAPATDLEVVRAPDRKGVLVIRRLVRDIDSEWPDIENLREQDLCEPSRD